MNQNKKLDEDTKREGLNILQKELDWLEENDDGDTEEYKNKKTECEEKMKPIVAKMYEGSGMDAGSGVVNDDDVNNVPNSSSVDEVD